MMDGVVQGAGEDGWIEDYTAGQAQRITGNYRPRSTLLLVSRLLGKRFASTPIGEHFARPMMGQGAV